MTDVREHVAFITGGANGIGLGIAHAMARAGAKLALADIDAAALARAKAELANVTQVEAFELDVRDRESYASVADAAEAVLGPVSLLFNNAGVSASAAVDKLTYELWDWAIGINLGGVINGVQTFLPRMIERGATGHIVNTASGAGLAATPAGVLYSTAKFGVVGLSETLRNELAPAGIGVSVLCPGPVATGIVQRSADLAPKGGDRLSEADAKLQAERLQYATQMLQQGVGIDAVGEMVLDAVRRDKLYIFTDRLIEAWLTPRAKALADALPA